VMLRTFDELNYRQEPRLHLELGLMKLVHLQRLLPLEQILSGLPAPARITPSLKPASPSTPRALPIPPPRPAAVEPVKPSPFELDRQRKSVDEPEAATPAPAPVETTVATLPVEPDPPAPAAKTSETNLDSVRDAVTAALDEQGHNTAATMLGDGRWKLDQDGAIQVTVGMGKTMLGLTMNAEAWKIVGQALRDAGATKKMTVVPGETNEPANSAPRVRSRDSIEAVALGNPLVRQAQELFHAEVRSVLDLREKPGK
jgi:DNA polymerase-3 subunit gamma/tau